MKIFCDGGARGNPGPAASSFVVYKDNDEMIHSDSKFLGDATNNVAEYTALIMALEWMSENGSEDTDIILDSELVKKQMTGEYRIKNANLAVLAARAKHLEKNMSLKVTYVHTPRAGNPVADALVNETLDKHSK